MTQSRTRRRRSRSFLRSTAESRARLCFVLLVYYVAVVALVSLAPFNFSLDGDVRIVTTTTIADAIDGVFLFLPLGFLYPLTRPRRDPSRARVFAWGASIAALVMLAQMFEADREIPLIELASAMAGIVIGMELLRVVNRRTRTSKRFSGRLSLELPLVGLIYMLMPVVSTTTLRPLSDPQRVLMLVPLALLAARLFAGVQRHHFGPAGVFTDRAMSIVAAGWMIVATFPTFAREPMIVAGIVLVVAIGTYHWATRPVIHGLDRRFEGDMLRSAAPVLAAYFIALAALPLIAGVGPWHASIWLTGASGDVGEQITRLLEPLTAFAMLGYVLAEWRGRRELGFRAVGLRVAGECLAAALIVEAGRGVQLDAGASALSAVLSAIAGVIGARIYHQQREHVRSMLIRRRDSQPQRAPLVSLRQLT